MLQNFQRHAGASVSQCIWFLQEALFRYSQCPGHGERPSLLTVGSVYLPLERPAFTCIRLTKSPGHRQDCQLYSAEERPGCLGKVFNRIMELDRTSEVYSPTSELYSLLFRPRVNPDQKYNLKQTSCHFIKFVF